MDNVIFLTGLGVALLLAVGPAAWVVRRERERRGHHYARGDRR
jgi:hypothetical protein